MIDSMMLLAVHVEDIAAGAGGGVGAGVLAMLAIQAFSRKRNGRGLTEDQARTLIEMNMTLKQILAEMKTMNGRK